MFFLIFFKRRRGDISKFERLPSEDKAEKNRTFSEREVILKLLFAFFSKLHFSSWPPRNLRNCTSESLQILRGYSPQSIPEYSVRSFLYVHYLIFHKHSESIFRELLLPFEYQSIIFTTHILQEYLLPNCPKILERSTKVLQQKVIANLWNKDSSNNVGRNIGRTKKGGMGNIITEYLIKILRDVPQCLNEFISGPDQSLLNYKK